MSVTEKTSAEAHERPKVEPALKLNFLSHGTLECREIEWSRKFYEEFLGLEVVQTSAISLLTRLGGDHVVAVVKSKKVHEMNLLNHNGLDVRTKEEVDTAHRIVTEQADKWKLTKITKRCCSTAPIASFSRMATAIAGRSYRIPRAATAGCLASATSRARVTSTAISSAPASMGEAKILALPPSRS
jgi:hypothetical protein